MDCPNCKYHMDEPYEEGNLKVENSGSGFNGEYMQHWFVGILTCPECKHEFEVSDSN